MARTNNRGSSKFAANPQGVTKALGFFSGVDSSVERVDLWDIKTQPFVDAVLGLVGRGYSVGFYTQWNGEAIVMRIYQGDARDDHPVRDAIELDTLMAAVLEKFRLEEMQLEK